MTSLEMPCKQLLTFAFSEFPFETTHSIIKRLNTDFINTKCLLPVYRQEQQQKRFITILI